MVVVMGLGRPDLWQGDFLVTGLPRALEPCFCELAQLLPLDGDGQCLPGRKGVLEGSWQPSKEPIAVSLHPLCTALMLCCLRVSDLLVTLMRLG